MSNTSKIIVLIWFVGIAYYVMDPSILDLSISNTGSNIPFDVSNTNPEFIEECTSNGTIVQCVRTNNPNYEPPIKEDSYPLMIPEIELPDFEVTNDHFLIIGYSFLVIIAGIVVVIAWKKTKPVIELGEE